MRVQNKPVAVLISDVHYTPATLPLAHEAMTAALREAEALRVPLIDAGDLLDTKAIIRAECANALIDLFKNAQTEIILLVGNHTLLNEKGSEHALHFLAPYATVIAHPTVHKRTNLALIPYQSSPNDFIKSIEGLSKQTLIVAHQGVKSAYMGHYTQDKTSIDPEELDGRRIISGHYHRRQTIKCGKTGVWDYLGNPYSLNYGEASDGLKGFHVLMSDGALEFRPLSLPKHVKLNVPALDYLGDLHEILMNFHVSPRDKVWVTITGAESELETVDRDAIATLLGVPSVKLDLVKTDLPAQEIEVARLTDAEILDSLIDNSGETPEQVSKLKSLWREVYEVT